MSFFVLGSLMIVFCGCAIVRTRVRRSRLARLSWDDLVAKLEPVAIDGIASAALDYLHPTKGQIELEPNELWAMIGGADGLRRMYANADVLIALAGYAQRWNNDESVIVGERMRRDGLMLRRATFKLSFGLAFRKNTVSGPFNLQEAATAYYLMRERLLALYESSHAGRYPRLAAVL